MRKKSMKAIKHLFTGALTALALFAASAPAMATPPVEGADPIGRTLDFVENTKNGVIEVFVTSGYAIAPAPCDNGGTDQDGFCYFGPNKTLPVPILLNTLDRQKNVNKIAFPREAPCDDFLFAGHPLEGKLSGQFCKIWDIWYKVISADGVTMGHAFGNATAEADIVDCFPDCQIQQVPGSTNEVPVVEKPSKNSRWIKYNGSGETEIVATLITGETDKGPTDIEVVLSKSKVFPGVRLLGNIAGPGNTFKPGRGLVSGVECIKVGRNDLFRLKLVPKGAEGKTRKPEFFIGECDDPDSLPIGEGHPKPLPNHLSRKVKSAVGSAQAASVSHKPFGTPQTVTFNTTDGVTYTICGDAEKFKRGDGNTDPRNECDPLQRDPVTGAILRDEQGVELIIPNFDFQSKVRPAPDGPGCTYYCNTGGPPPKCDGTTYVCEK